MKIHIIRQKATPEQMEDILEGLGEYIKVAVDVKRSVLAGGGELHADCEAVLLDDGSKQEDIWGANWYPSTQEVKFEALINIRPKQNNRSMEIQDQKIRLAVEQITRLYLKGV